MKKLSLSLVTLLTTTMIFGANFELDQICDGSGALTASETEIAKKFPIGDCNALSKSRGGNLDDVDAVKDGSGVVTLAPIGQTKTTDIQKSRNGIIELIKKYPQEAKKAKESGEPFILYLQENNIEDISEVKKQRELFGKGLGEIENKEILFGYFKVKDMVWPSAYKMFAAGITVNGTFLTNGQTDWNAQGASPSGRPASEGQFHFHETKVTGPLSTGSATISLHSPITITAATDIRIEHLTGAFYYPNQRISRVTFEFYTTENQLISSRTYNNIDGGVKVGQNVCWKAVGTSYNCANLLTQPNINTNLEF